MATRELFRLLLRVIMPFLLPARLFFSAVTPPPAFVVDWAAVAAAAGGAVASMALAAVEELSK